MAITGNRYKYGDDTKRLEVGGSKALYTNLARSPTAHNINVNKYMVLMGDRYKYGDDTKRLEVGSYVQRRDKRTGVVGGEEYST